MRLTIAIVAFSLFSLLIPVTSFAQVDSNLPGDLQDLPDPPDVSSSEALPTNGVYHGVQWDSFTPVIGLDFGFPFVQPPWTMDCGVGSCWFTVVDGGLPEDRFEVFDFGGSIGITPIPNIISGDDCGFLDPDACLANPNFSSGTFCLGPGTHSITMNQLLGFGPGAGWIKTELHSTNECNGMVPVGGELIPLDTSALLLAGAQMNAAWMIPVLVSGIGFAIVIARKF